MRRKLHIAPRILTLSVQKYKLNEVCHHHHFSCFPKWGIGPHALSFQVVLSFAAVAASVHDLNPLSLTSLSTVLLHVSRGRPRFRFPSGAQVRAMRECEWWSILSTWPSHVHLRLATWSLIVSLIPALRLTSSFVMCIGQKIFNIRLKLL